MLGFAGAQPNLHTAKSSGVTGLTWRLNQPLIGGLGTRYCSGNWMLGFAGAQPNLRQHPLPAYPLPTGAGDSDPLSWTL